jgi:serine/threonine protein kinase
MATAVRYLSQLSSGAAALASVNLAHRDLTLRNVLITFDDSIRIGDFGTAVLPDSQTWMGLSNIATGAFSRTLAPEVRARCAAMYS